MAENTARSKASVFPDWLGSVISKGQATPTRSIPSIKAQWVWVTPETAAALLELNTDNRKLRQTKVDQYARLMLAGQWDEQTPQFVVIDEQRNIADAQHRLWAIEESKQPQWMLICWDVPKLARLNIDQNTRRTVADNLVFSGLLDRLPTGFDERALVGMCNAMRYQTVFFKKSMAPAEIVEWCQDHHQAIQWTIDAFGAYKRVNNISIGPVFGLFARAYYYAEANQALPRLSEAVKVLMTGVVEAQGDQAIVPFRDWLLSIRGKNSNANCEIYQRGASALMAFFRKEPRVLVRPNKQNLFRLASDPVNVSSRAGRANRVAGNTRVNGTRRPRVASVVAAGKDDPDVIANDHALWS